MYELRVVSFFSGAHSLRGYKGKCEALHGHNWKIEVVVKSKQLGAEGLVLDFTELKAMLNSVLDKLDHKNLNRINFFSKINPSSENIARFIYKKLKPLIERKKSKLKKVTVWEQRDYSASYYEE